MIEGLSVPMVTMFGPEGALDGPKNARFARALCDARVDHVFVLGSIGEFPLVTEAEREDLLEAVIESLTWKTDAWVGCGAPSTSMAVARAEAAEEAGAALVVAVPPFYLHPTPAAIARYYRAIHAALGVPLLAYNIPSLVGYALAPSMVHDLAREKVLVGIKDTSGAIESVRGFLSGAPEGFAVMPGNDPLALGSIESGASGAVMGLANIAPKLCVELVAAARSGRIERARELNEVVSLLARVVEAGPFPSTVKFLAERLRRSEVGYRAPYDPLTPEEQSKVVEELGRVEPKLAPFLVP